MCCTQPQFYFYFSSRKSFLEVETNERKRSVQSSGELSVLRIDEGERESLLLLVVPQPIDVDKSSRNARKSVCRG